MEGAPATALVPVRANNEAAPLASTTPGVVSSTPVEDAAKKKARDKHSTTLRRVVEVKEMELGDLCETHGLGACLKTMAEREDNPILQDGECVSLPCIGRQPTIVATALLLLVPPM
jgi:hypothetical protein